MTTNVMNIMVQWQLFALFVYAGLLVNQDVVNTGVLAGVDEVSVATGLTLFNLSVIILSLYLAWIYTYKVSREKERIRVEMAAQAAQEAEHAAEGHALRLPQVIQDFTPVSEKGTGRGCRLRLASLRIGRRDTVGASPLRVGHRL